MTTISNMETTAIICLVVGWLIGFAIGKALGKEEARLNK